jgi:hypothetical protein
MAGRLNKVYLTPKFHSEFDEHVDIEAKFDHWMLEDTAQLVYNVRVQSLNELYETLYLTSTK